MVGCVIVYDDKIIGEGYHRRFGGPHAEVNAINDVSDKNLLSRSTMYVTLEPCSHFGKTPPCADLVIKHQLRKVVICNVDPNPVVSGRGIERLKKAGIHVEIGLLENHGADLNKRFFTSIQKQRPYIVLKWAETLDGFIARENHDSKWISNQYSRQQVHKWRSEEDAIMVGTNTAKHDDPSLTVRDWAGRNPVRIFIDKKRTLGRNLKLYDGKAKTLCFTEMVGPDHPNVEYVYMQEITAELVLKELYAKGIQSLIVEGGSQLLKSFIDKNLWDEARVFVGQKTFGAGIGAPKVLSQHRSETYILEDRLTIYKNAHT